MRGRMKKLLFALGTAIPLLYGLGLLVLGDTRVLLDAYPIVLAVSAVTWVAYIVDVIRNPRLDSGRRALWIALLVFGSIFAEVGYLVVHIFRRDTVSA